LLIETKREKEKEKKKIHISPHMSLWLFLPIFHLGHSTWFRWFGNVTRHIRILFESKKCKANQKK
jgi:hypothetical protein